MKVFDWKEIKDSDVFKQSFNSGTAISIGSFDGLHQGHRQLLSLLKDGAEKLKLAKGVLTFSRPLPSYKHSENYQGDLSSLSIRLRLFEELGMDFVIVVNFDEEFSSVSGIDFLKKLIDVCGLKFIAEGADFRCGYKGATDTSAIRYFCEENQVQYDFLDPVFTRPGTEEEERISSSYIREMVLKGFFATVNELLERHYEIELTAEDSTLHFPRNKILQALPPQGKYNATSDGFEAKLEINESEVIVNFYGKREIQAGTKIILRLD